MVLLTHGDSVATVAPGFASCAQTTDKKVAGQISLHVGKAYNFFTETW